MSYRGLNRSSPKQSSIENINDITTTRNNLTWDSFIIPLDNQSSANLITRIIAVFQILGLYNPDPTKGSALNDFIALISEKQTKNQAGKSIYLLDEEILDTLDEYSGNLSDTPYLNFKLNNPIDFSVIRSDKSRKNDRQATDNDLKKTRTGLVNLITHTHRWNIYNF